MRQIAASSSMRTTVWTYICRYETAVDDISDGFLDGYVAVQGVVATFVGVAGHWSGPGVRVYMGAQ